MKIRIFSLFIFLFFLPVLTISSCRTGTTEATEATEDEPIVLVVLAGNHANALKPDVQLDILLQEVYSTFGNAGIIVVDQNPTLLYDEDTHEIVGCYNTGDLTEPKKRKNTNEDLWKKNYLVKQVDSFKKALDQSIADDPEVDTLKALQVAVEALNTIEASMKTDVKKEILVLDTGLCTCGALDFQRSDLLTLLRNDKKLRQDKSKADDVALFINSLDDTAEIPDLSDITITWYGLGKTAAPQQDLTNLNLENLQYLWSEILKKSGAIPSRAAGTDSKDGIFVTSSAFSPIVSVHDVTPITIQTDVAEETTAKSTESSTAESKGNETTDPRPGIPITEDILGFEPNSDVFRSEEDAYKTVSPYADCYKNNPDKKIILVGTTSSWEGGSVSLSEKRAKKVREKLIEAGVPGDKISIVGLGYDLDFCINDTPNGNFIEEIAKENRAVRILFDDSDDAQMALEKYKQINSSN